TYDDFKKMGFDTRIDPRRIQVFGNAGGMLPQTISVSRPVDLTQNAIFVSGESDGSFDKGDYILFFAEGPDRIQYHVQREIFAYESNLYSEKNFYFVTVGDDEGKRVVSKPNIEGNFPVVQHYDDFVYHEVDEYNVLSSGREWFGERFDISFERTFNIDLSGVLENSPIKVVSDVMGQSYGTSSFNLFWNNTLVKNQVIPIIPNTQYGIKGAHKRDTVSINSSMVSASGTTSQQIKYQFNKAPSGASVGNLDFFLLNVKRALEFSAHQILFRSGESLSYPVSTFLISKASANCFVWDITQPAEPQQQDYTLGDAAARFSSPSDQLHEYIIFDNEIPAPELVSKIENQNLHGLATPNFVIISHPDFFDEASRLASHREQHNSWTSAVVTPEQIFLEFSSGRQDVTAIRDFIKQLYDKNPNTLKAVLLMGKGSYDYKDRIQQNTNFVPTYESRNSLSPLATYSSDDYFAFLENDEGNWGESPVQNHTLDVGVGRLPVKTVEEAKNLVDKIIYYDTHKKSFGHWRKDIAFVGDDGNNTDNFTSSHQSQANSMAESIELSHPEFNAKKIFLGKYIKTVKPNGETIPEASKDVISRFDRGSLIINFTGHGNEKQWADEKIFSDIDIDELENELYPFLVTATCEFGRQDDPTVVSSAELSVLRPKGGAIGLVTTARPVNAGTNFVLNQEFYKALFQKQSSQYGTLGEIFRNTKNNSTSGVSNRNFSLLADPSMRLAIPSESVVVTTLKTSTGSDTLKALSTVTMKGEIRDESGTVMDDFNGTLEFTLFDKEVNFVTIGKNDPPFQYNEWYNALYRGKASVTSGTFQFDFVLTKNVAYEIGQGKLSLYASDPTHQRDASGAIQSFKIGGTEPSFTPDNTSPVMQLFMGDTTFISGGVVNSNSTLIVNLQDKSGINISGYGVGNALVAYLDNEEQAYILNDYYEAYMNDFTRGSVHFPMKGLSPGRHSITVKAWDTHNNPAQATLEFVVTDGENIVIETFANFPNPFESETSIFFTHNRSGDDLQAQLVIYSANGMQLKTYEYDIKQSSYRVDLGVINDLYDFGKKLPGGLYLARLVVRSLTNGSKNERVTKLIVVN
ncbi:MAG TPA: type IX secretion system sortase PorU, partial [Chryseolinea sp.]|nr:type IX secretion system sortase PorU [Chryseolinea sp.]